MASPSLFEDCQTLIEREHESWKSYFTKWEVFAKYEEEIPESDLIEKINDSIKPVGKKKIRFPKTKNRKTLSLIKSKKNQKNHRKIIKKKQTPLKTASPLKLELSKGDENEFPESRELETNLRLFFRNFLKENQNKFEIFGVLSLAFSGSQDSNCYNLSFNHEQAMHSYDSQLQTKALSCMNQQRVFSNIPKMVISGGQISLMRNNLSEYLSRSMSFVECPPQVEPRKWNISNDQFSRYEFCLRKNWTQSHNNLTKMSLSSRSLLLRSSSSELKSLDRDLSPKSPVSISRKINREYFIKRTLPKINITLDGKRFRNLCLHKRTNSVSLSMENSNFTTPERKPPERKCFSENVLQRKRRCPSKLFFDNEEDSESDDQTENRAPLIRIRNKKPKIQIMTEVLESDSDEYESIFDRVKKC